MVSPEIIPSALLVYAGTACSTAGVGAGAATTAAGTGTLLITAATGPIGIGGLGAVVGTVAVASMTSSYYSCKSVKVIVQESIRVALTLGEELGISKDVVKAYIMKKLKSKFKKFMDAETATAGEGF
jgi:hypothetical protein